MRAYILAAVSTTICVGVCWQTAFRVSAWLQHRHAHWWLMLGGIMPTNTPLLLSLPSLPCNLADPFAAWLDAGMERVRSTSSGHSVRDYTASYTFVEDWRAHRVWDWLNHQFWKFIPTGRRVLHVQVGCLEISDSFGSCVVVLKLCSMFASWFMPLSVQGC